MVGRGIAVGTNVGTRVGTNVGTSVGTNVGTRVGTNVGTKVGTGVGTNDGTGVGTNVGTVVVTLQGSGRGSRSFGIGGNGIVKQPVYAMSSFSRANQQYDILNDEIAQPTERISGDRSTFACDGERSHAPSAHDG